MSIFVKPGVEFTFHPAGFKILEALRQASKTLRTNFTITSGSDGAHSGPADPHKTGEAYDIRTKDLTPQGKAKLLDFLKVTLGPRFYAFLEAPGTQNEHIHCQRAKGTTYSIKDYLNS